MSILPTSNIRRYEDIEALVDITASMPLFVSDTLFVSYGDQGLPATENVDYEIILNEVDYSDFTFRPFESLLDKISGLVLAEPEEQNVVTLVRTLPLSTDSSPGSARSSEFVSKEFDRITMKLQQLAGDLAQSVKLPASYGLDYDLDLPPWSTGAHLAWHSTLKKLVNVTSELATALVDTDPTLTANSDLVVPSQKAIRAYIEAQLAGIVVTPEMFGAVGDGVTDDTAALRAASAYIAASGGTISMRPGAVYYGGLQTAGGPAYRTGQSLLYASNVPYFRVLGNGATIKFKAGMLFGSFNPATGLPTGGINTVANQRADIGYAVSANNVGMFECTDLIIDGSSDVAVLGGLWGDTGRQCSHYGVYALDCGYTVLRNLSVFNSCLDGISYGHANLTARSPIKPLLCDNVKIDSCARNDFSLVGTNRARFTNCQFSKGGSAPNTVSGAFGSAPASCFDIEAENGSYCQDIRISACKMIAGATTLTSIVADSGTSRDILIEDCVLVGSLWLKKPRCRVVRSEIRGRMTSLYGGAADPLDNVEFSDCLISDDVSAFAGVATPTGLLLDTEGAGAGVKLNRVTLKVNTTRINLRNSIQTGYMNITFATGVSRITNQDYGILASGADWDNAKITEAISPGDYPTDAFYIEAPTTSRDCTLISASAKLRWISWSSGAGGHQGDMSKRELQGARLVLPRGGRSDYYNGKVTLRFDAAVPTTGTWVRGDVVFNDTPAVDAPFAWRCTAAGTPGTWEALYAHAELANTATYNPPPLAAGVVDTVQTMTVTGAALGDYVSVSFSLDLQGIVLRAWVSAANTVAYQFSCPAGGATVDLAAGTVRCRVSKL